VIADRYSRPLNAYEHSRHRWQHTGSDRPGPLHHEYLHGADRSIDCAARIGTGHHVTLLTSHPETAKTGGVNVLPYRTFDELRDAMESQIAGGRFDCIVHCAAVSDYASGGIYASAPGTRFDSQSSTWQGNDGPPTLRDRSAGKVKSDEPELWLRLVRTPKIVDMIRDDWSFQGILVKFKLEVGIDERTLQDRAEASRRASDANLMVANTLEGSRDWALLGPVAGRYERITRDELPRRLLDEIESLHG
jgi:phosphopantothenoylcysteine synthetase/decarboxylase